MALVDLARARLHPEANQVADDLLTVALAAAEEKIIQLVGQSIGLVEHTDTLNVKSSFRLWLEQLPVVSITTVTTMDLVTGETATIDPTDLDFNPTSGEVRYKQGVAEYFPLGWRNIQIVYWAGVASAPQIVQEAIIQMALSLVEVSGTSNLLRLGSETGDYADSLRAIANEGIPPLILQMLKDYSVPGVTIDG